MNFTDIFLIGIGLAMDAFAVSVCKGLCMKKINYRQAVIIALFFGGFQALMPLTGFFLGTFFEKYITAVDHWIAFALLLYIGGKMLWDTLSSDDEEIVCPVDNRLNFKELFIMAVATSIDALAVGITFSFYKNTNIFANISIIGITTYIIAFAGVVIGNKFGTRFKKKAEISGLRLSFGPIEKRRAPAEAPRTEKQV